MSARYFEIQNGIPIPGLQDRLRIDPLLRTMDVGTSFIVPVDTIAHIRSLIDEVGAETGNRYLGAGVPDGFRVWRLK
jgi:hypothetical protein